LDDPDYRGDWNTLRDFTAAELEDVRTTISGLPAIPRENLHTRIDAVLAFNTVSVLAGVSGAGKSALAKTVAALSGKSHGGVQLAVRDEQQRHVGADSGGRVGIRGSTNEIRGFWVVAERQRPCGPDALWRIALAREEASQ
jgi:energy-coupling factor transporter ATP-binding protein EcfA2